MSRCLIYGFMPVDIRVSEAERHGGEVNPPKDYDYTAKGLSPNLVPVYTAVRGDIIRAGWYDPLDLPAYDAVTEQATGGKLVVEAVMTWHYDSDTGRPNSRDTERRWYRDDASYHPDVKLTTKDYTLNPRGLLDAVSRRNKNIVNKLGLLVVGVLKAGGMNDTQANQAAQDFGKHHKESIDLFRDWTRNQIYFDIQADATHVWLDSLVAPGVTLRMLMLDELNVWGL